MATLYLVEMVVYDPSIPGTRTLRYGTRGFVTTPAESPANTFYDERVKQAANVRRDLFQAGTTQGRSVMGFGDLVLANDDGALDALLNYAFDGRAITIRQATLVDGVRPAYPAGFTTVLTGTMEQPEFSATAVTVKLRDRQYEIDIPLQATKYAGSNTLPTGLEGVAGDLKGKPKPVCYGVVKNVPAPCVNTAKLIYQVNDGAVSAISGVYDKGILLISPRKWTAQTSGFGANAVSGVAYGASLWVVAGGAATGLISTSTDAVTWTSRTVPVGHTAYTSLTFGNGLFVAGTDTGQIATSPDGITWTSRTSGFGASIIYTVAYGNGLYLAGGQAGTLTTSPDGITWTARTSGFGASNIYGLGYGRLYVAVGAGGIITTSPDGITWTSRTSGTTQDIRGSVAFGNGLFAAGLTAGAAEILTSPDGIAWTQHVVAELTGNILGMAYGAGYYVAAAAGGTMGISRDGFAWERVTAATSNALQSVAFGNNFFVVGGVGGHIGTSPSGGEAYATLADLSDDTLAPAQGTYKVYLAGGYFRLGSTPVGLVTADVTQGATAADRTAAQVFTQILTKVGKTSGDWVAADITALDTAAAYVIGYWTDQEITAALVMDEVAGSVGAWWGVDIAGDYRIKQLTLPSGSPVAAYVATDLLSPLARITMQDQGRGIPVYRSIVRWGRLYAVQATDLAGGVTDDRRAELAQEWREASFTDAAVQTAHLLSPQTIENSLLTVAADAEDEAERRQILRGARRDRFDLVLEATPATMAIDLGQVVTLTHARYGLSAGKNFRVIGIDPDAASNKTTLSVWG